MSRTRVPGGWVGGGWLVIGFARAKPQADQLLFMQTPFIYDKIKVEHALEIGQLELCLAIVVNKAD